MKFYIEPRSVLHTARRRKAKWIGHILRRNLFLKKCYWRKDGRKERSDEKTKMKT